LVLENFIRNCRGTESLVRMGQT